MMISEPLFSQQNLQNTIYYNLTAVIPLLQSTQSILLYAYYIPITNYTVTVCFIAGYTIRVYLQYNNIIYLCIVICEHVYINSI